MHTRRTATLRPVLAALVLALAPVVSHITAPRAAAIFLCGHTYCGALNISPSGAGSGEVTSDPAGDDCLWSGATQTHTGTCSYLFGWDDSPSTYVDVSVTPTASSIACVDGPCAGAGQAVGTSVVLNDQSVTTLSVMFLKAQALTITLNPSGQGSGRITSSPAGLDCRVLLAARSGTCSHTWYANGSISVGVTYTPDPGSAYCSSSCLPVGTPQTITRSTATTAEFNLTDGFELGHPIVTVAVQGQGTVTSSPAGISCPSTCHSYFPPATSLNLTATPASGYVLTGWSGACSAAGIVTTCIMALGSGDVSTTAIFARQVTPPTTTPRPTATAQSTARPSGGPTLAPTSPPLSGPTPSAPSGDTASPSPSVSETSAGAAGPTPPAASASTPAGAVAPPVATLGTPPGSPADPAASGALDVVPLLLVLVGVLIAVVVVLIVAVARLRGGRRPS